MYVYIYIYIYTCIDINTCTYGYNIIHMHPYVFPSMYMYISLHVRINPVICPWRSAVAFTDTCADLSMNIPIPLDHLPMDQKFVTKTLT